MNSRKERIIETFILGMFPIALFVGCTTNGNEQHVASTATQLENSYIEEQLTLGVDDLNSLTFLDTYVTADSRNTIEQIDSANTVTSEPVADNNDMAIMQFAVYKPDALEQQNQLKAKIVKYSQLPQSAKLEKFIFRFESGEYNLDRMDLEELAAHADFLNSHPTFTVTVSGHTDHIGPAQRNLVLSKQRAKFIAEILKTYGVSEIQIIEEGYGESVPLSNKANLEENRRVELQYSETVMLSAM